METIRIPLSKITDNTFTFLEEANRLAREGKDFVFSFSDPLFKRQLHIITCKGIQNYFIRVSSSFNRELITLVNTKIATTEVWFELEDDHFVIYW